MNKEKLKKYLKTINIDCAGIAGVNINKKLEKTLKDRVQKNYITGMEEENIQKRIDPTMLMQNAKSIIVCAFPYYTDCSESSNLSKYCRGIDYHIVAKEKLQNVASYLEGEIENFEYEIFVDNGPLVDRELAYMSGIGYFGINNNIITDEYGSYVFIGYIVNNYDFVSDSPIDKSCIKCGKCVKYCPGNALLDNYEMDAKKCLSYITQKKGELSENEKEILVSNKKIFGCDVCQDVCPHNQDIKKTNIDEFTTSIITNLEYEEISELSNREFKRMYGNRAFSWRGKGIIKRNLEIILKK